MLRGRVGKVNIRVVEFEWKIRVDSLKYLHKDDVILSSYTFATSFRKEIKWWLNLQTLKNDNDHLSVYLRNTVIDSDSFDVKFNVTFFLLNKNNLKFNEMSLEHILMDGKDTQVSKFVKKSFLTDEKNNLIKDDLVTIMCRISFIDSYLNQESFSRLQEFDDFEKLFLNHKFSDFTIESADEKKLHVHKAVLSSRSPVFEAMFDNDMIEKSQNVATIQDFNYDVLLEMFRFIYSGRVNEIETILCELLKAAEKYSIEGLKLMCEETMVDKLNESNAIEYLIEADKNNAVFSKIRIMKFIATNLKSFLKKPEFKSQGISHYDLMYEIINTVADEKDYE